MVPPPPSQPAPGGGPAGAAEDAEPKPQKEPVRFEEADFRPLEDPLAGDPQFDDARLKTRRKLATLGKEFCVLSKAQGLQLDSRSSIHHPRVWNGNRVRRLWTYAMRPKAEKTRLRRILGADLAKDLDAAYRNAYLCIAIEPEALEVSLRIHGEAWYDAQNLLGRLKKEGLRPFLAELNRLPGYQLKLHDWKGEWPLGQLGSERLEEYLKYFKPGEHRLSIERRWPAPPGQRAALCGPDVPATLLAECLRLTPLYRFAAWSEESSFLFSG
jgi:hypothetical protein